MHYPSNLTPEEIAELTPLNAIAFDLARTKSEHTLPRWLCLSQESKKEFLDGAVKFFNEVFAVLPLDANSEKSLAAANAMLDERIGAVVQRWINEEAEFKRMREEENNPRAFFCYDGPSHTEE